MSNNVMTWNEFKASNFPMRDYEYPQYEGRISGCIAAKVWGKSQNILLYIDTDEGENLKVSVWDNDDNYTGIKDAAVGSHLFMRLAETRTGRIRVDSISMEDAYEELAME